MHYYYNNHLSVMKGKSIYLLPLAEAVPPRKGWLVLPDWQSGVAMSSCQAWQKRPNP
jgi:hypothetical protein